MTLLAFSQTNNKWWCNWT